MESFSEILKRLDREGKLQNIFHPEVYAEFVQWVLDGEKGEFVINKLTRTGLESVMALDDELAGGLEWSVEEADEETETVSRDVLPVVEIDVPFMSEPFPEHSHLEPSSEVRVPEATEL